MIIIYMKYKLWLEALLNILYNVLFLLFFTSSTSWQPVWFTCFAAARNSNQITIKGCRGLRRTSFS